jgi:nicotinamide riboside transporter PnuC
MSKKIIAGTLGVIVVFFLLVLADLVPFWMPMMGEMVVLAVVTIALVLFLAFIIAEQAADEREVVLAMHSGRVAYVAGILTLLLALIAQVLEHAVDPWVPVALAVMVGSKVASRWYLE